MAVRYYNDDCKYRLPQKRLTAEWLRRVVVHGVLHLCGQGDKTPRSNAQMHRKEDKYLKFWEKEE